MACRNCHKEFGDEIEYCPHCGIATQEPTEAENRAKSDSRGLAKGLLIFLVLSALSLLFCIPAASNEKHRDVILGALLGLALIWAVILFGVGRNMFDIWRGRKLPLIKRIAVVAEKRQERSRRSTSSYITFAFLDQTCLEFPKRIGELEPKDRIILKYKRVGEFQKPVYYGYERLEEQVKD